MDNKTYDRGSEWRRWDLHVHTPISVCQQYGENNKDTWNKYISDLENLSEDFAVIGVNDYLFLDGYKILKKEQKENNRLNKLRLLPVVEFRIDKFAGVDFKQLKRINLHVIFSDEVEIETIQSQFLNTLEQSYFIDGGKEWTRAININSVSELGKEIKKGIPDNELKKYGSDLTEGFNNLNINEEQIFKSLKKDCFKGKYIIAIGKTEWDELKWTDGSIAEKKSIINKSDIVFTAAESIEKFQNAKNKLTDQQVNDRLLDCSDAHYFSSETTIKDRIGNCNTWIKADPTFEGLKQILFEYEERVRIQEKNPALDFEKPYFSRIKIANDEIIFHDENDLIFSKNDNGIPLNQNLVAIIGGRGEGKSMLTDYIASSFAGQSNSKEGDFKKEGNICIEYFKTNQETDEKIEFTLGNETHSIEFIYINQGQLKNKVEQTDEKSSLANSIRKLAKLDEPRFDKNLNNDILKEITEYHELSDFFQETDESNNLINDLPYLQKKESSINEFIRNITTEENKDKLTRYSLNIKQINDLNLKKEQINRFEEELKTTIKYLNSKILNLNTGETSIPELTNNTFESQFSAIKTITENISESIQEKTKTIESVKEEFKDYKGDLTTLLNDIYKFQNSLFSVKNKIEDVNKRKIRYSELNKLIFNDEDKNISYVSKIKKDYERQKIILENDWAKFNRIEEREDLNSAQKDIMKKLLVDLSIEVIIDFDSNKFYDEITNSINGSIWRAKNNTTAKKDKFKITDIISFFSFMRESYFSFYQEGMFYKEEFKNCFFDESIRTKFIKVFPVLKYKGKDLNKISVGQKGTVYLKMMLATEAFSKPIIFDQPEDDLDNEFIMTELIGLFKNLKKFRQVIIVTHNANLVINADAEQVIIAKNTNGKLSYSSGSLENENINNDICKILEGGETAFEKRRNKYKYSK